jgi:hypothetical protein
MTTTPPKPSCDATSANDLRLRAEGLTVHRYDWILLHDEPRQIRDESLWAFVELEPQRLSA